MWTINASAVTGMNSTEDKSADWTLWLEVKSIYDYFLAAQAPTGIQRVAISLWSAWSKSDAGSGPCVRLCWFDPKAQHFCEIPKDLFAGVVSGTLKTCQPVDQLSKSMPLWTRLQRRFKIVHYGALQRCFGGSENKLKKWRDYPVTRHLEQTLREMPSAPVSSTDVVLLTCANLGTDNNFEQLRSAKRANGFRLAWIVYDLLPYLRPEFFPPETHERFRRDASELVLCADLALCISRATLQDLTHFAVDIGTPLRETAVVRLGSDGADQALPTTPPSPEGQAARRQFVLITGTLEPRKNHAAAIGAWQRLIERHGSDKIPDLVLAGKRGWLVDQTFELLASTKYLDGKVIHRSEVVDKELAELYRGCLFTLYPSLYEGYGLPVAESLRFGKLCIASNAPSILEIGDDLVDYVDPNDADALYGAVERAIFDDDYRRGREAKIAREHRPYLWRDCAAHVMSVIADHRDSELKA